MKEIDLSLLAQRLWDAEETKTLPPPPVSDYVMQHIFQPLSQDKPVLFAELDFTAFDASDLDVLEEYLEEVCMAQRELSAIAQAIHHAQPVASQNQAYC